MTSAQAESLDVSGLRLAELIGVMSLAVDLGLGQPTEHGLRASLIGLRLAERLGLGEEERAAAVYDAALIAWVGCHADGHEQARWFGDDIALRAGTYQVDMVELSAAGFFLRHLGAGQAPLQRGTPGGLVPGLRAAVDGGDGDDALPGDGKYVAARTPNSQNPLRVPN